MNKHHYRITIESVENSKDASTETLQFETQTHDDLLVIIERIRNQGQLDANSAAAFGLGLKLFGEALLANRDQAPFDGLAPHFGQFMKALKKGQ